MPPGVAAVTSVPVETTAIGDLDNAVFFAGTAVASMLGEERGSERLSRGGIDGNRITQVSIDEGGALAMVCTDLLEG